MKHCLWDNEWTFLHFKQCQHRSYISRGFFGPLGYAHKPFNKEDKMIFLFRPISAKRKKKEEKKRDLGKCHREKEKKGDCGLRQKKQSFVKRKVWQHCHGGFTLIL